jgi:hypothetical protein
MSRGTHSSGYFLNPWRAHGELTAGVPVPTDPASVAAGDRSRVRRALAPVALFVGAVAALAGFVWGTVATSAPATVPGQQTTGAQFDRGEQDGPMPGDLEGSPFLSGDRATVNPVVTTSP